MDFAMGLGRIILYNTRCRNEMRPASRIENSFPTAQT